MYVFLLPIGYLAQVSKIPFSQFRGMHFLELFLVGARGFEPPTPCAQGRCATRLRYAPTETVTTVKILNQFSPARRPGVPILQVSARAGKGIEDLKQFLISIRTESKLVYVQWVALPGSPNNHYSPATQLHRHWLRLGYWRKYIGASVRLTPWFDRRINVRVRPRSGFWIWPRSWRWTRRSGRWIAKKCHGLVFLLAKAIQATFLSVVLTADFGSRSPSPTRPPSSSSLPAADCIPGSLRGACLVLSPFVSDFF